MHHDVPFEKTHDLRVLSRQCGEAEPGLAAALGGVEALTVYAWRFRYPGSPTEPSADEARSDLAIATRAFDAVLERVPPEAHS